MKFFIATAVWHWPSDSKWMTELLSLGHFLCLPACLRKCSMSLMCRIKSLWGILGNWGQNVRVPVDKSKSLLQEFPWQEMRLISVKWHSEACLVSLEWKTLRSENDFVLLNKIAWLSWILVFACLVLSWLSDVPQNKGSLLWGRSVVFYFQRIKI